MPGPVIKRTSSRPTAESRYEEGRGGAGGLVMMVVMVVVVVVVVTVAVGGRAADSPRTGGCERC